MTRDELLAKLVMELGEWPGGTDIEWPSHLTKGWQESCGMLVCIDRHEGPITRIDWLDERERLINKPSWGEVERKLPGANFLAQNSNGWWHAFRAERNPYIHDGCHIMGHQNAKSVGIQKGAFPAGHDWRETLESRPEKQSAESRLHDATLASDVESFTAPGILRAGISHMEDRAATYDKPEGERSMTATVEAFKAVTGDGLVSSEERGWLFMVLLKMVRSQQGDLRMDSYQDGAAYCGLMGEAAAKERGQ